MIRALSSICLVCVVPLMSAGQQLHLAGPTTGLVFDQPSRSLRHILGSPGAARLGPVVVPDLDWASVAPDGRSALAGSQGAVLLFTFKNGAAEPASTDVPGVVDSPVYFSWTGESRAVVVYSTAARSVQWIRIDGLGPIADVPVPLTGVEGEVTAIAGDIASNLVVVAVAQAGIYQVSASTGTRQIAAVPDGSAIALADGGRTLWITDRANAQLVQVSAPGAGAVPQVMVSDPQRLNDITAIAQPVGGARLYLASRANQRLYLFDLASAALIEGPELDLPVSQFAFLGRPSLMLLLSQRDKQDQPLYVLDETSGANVYFIPAGEVR